MNADVPRSDGPAAIRTVPRTGVIYVTSEAERMGFRPGHPDWCNFGQGQPETGPLEGAPPRISTIPIDPRDQEYAPAGGLWELREAVAAMYNELHRRGMGSQYTAENVAVCGGGRVSLMRACVAIGPVHLGHFLPDYTAYAEVLDSFRRFSPIPILLDPESGYEFTLDQLRRDILGRGFTALLLSNPCNPTGKLIEGEEMQEWVDTARELDCTLLLDEFYSHYIWKDGANLVSAASHVKDVNRDPVVILDGLTKNWRYPGWRVSWIVGPKPVIEAVTSAGSFLDGGGSRPMQRAAIELVTADCARQETAAIQCTFRPKRDLLMAGLRDMGVRFDREPEGTFYAWGDLSGLPEPLRRGRDFFRAALDRKVITVPGAYFDVDPGKRRHGRPSRFRSYVRFSFGPPIGEVERGLAQLRKLVAD
jgi:aspartate/methionine/tyrosine aminotransferase